MPQTTAQFSLYIIPLILTHLHLYNTNKYKLYET